MSAANATLIASVLAGSWRRTPPLLTRSTEEVRQVVPLLVGSGAGALAWWRGRHQPSADRWPEELREAYRSTALQNALAEDEIRHAFSVLRAAGIEPILVKGYSAARLYARVDVRPFGDVDLLVQPDAIPAALAALREAELADRVDLDHVTMRRLRDRDWNDLFERSQLLPLGTDEVRVLGAEDQLAFLCLHALCHGLWRPLWLTDVAAAVEARPADFDWQRCLGTDPRVADWIVCAIGLAHRLLGARVQGTPAAERGRRLPRWLMPAVLHEWETPSCADHPVCEESILVSLRRPQRLLPILQQRWWNPIRATIWIGGPFNDMPRFPIQSANYLARAAAFLRRLASARGTP